MRSPFSRFQTQLLLAELVGFFNVTVGVERALAEESKGVAPMAAVSELAHRRKPRREWKPVSDSDNPDIVAAPKLQNLQTKRVYIGHGS
jgi:hypothetical protein